MFRNILILNFIFFLIFNSVYAQTINKIKINGNKRISTKTIEIFTKINLGEIYNENELNKIIRNLYETNFFKTIELSTIDDLIIITVDENPIIEDVSFEGINNSQLQNLISDSTKLKSRTSYSDNIALSDLDLIKKILKQNGFYFASIESKIIKNEEQNSIKIIYDIDIGMRAKIRKISFIGNNTFKDKNLRSIILSDEHKFWKFLSKKVYIDKNRIDVDKRLLLNFYKNNGFYNASVNNSFVEFEDKENFKLTFNITPGKIYTFNNFNLDIPVDYQKDHFLKIEKLFDKLKNKQYSLLDMENILNTIEEEAIKNNYEFVSVLFDESIVENSKINFNIKIAEGKKFFVDRINITGNFSTEEEVIRNLLIIDEGDPYNKILFNKSLNKIRSTGFFKKVESEVFENSDSTSKTIDIKVEEQPTGEVSLGAGIGTNGTTVGGGIVEKNFLGKGIALNTNISISKNELQGQFIYSKPNFNYSDNTLYTSVKNTSTDNLSKFGYKTNITAFSIGTTFEQYKNFYFSPTLDISIESLETNSTASNNLKKQVGDYNDLYLDYSIKYDQRNNPYRTTDGYVTNFYQELPIISDSSELTTSFEINKYKKLSSSGMIGKFTFFNKIVNTISGDDVRISRRLQLPSNKLKGFENGKIGPMDGDDFVGGNYASALNFSTTLPQILPTFQNVDFTYFIDVGNVWGVDYSSGIDDSNKIRSSTGIAMNLLTPVGPLNFSLAQPITKNKTDKTETFRFNLGTSF